VLPPLPPSLRHFVARHCRKKDEEVARAVVVAGGGVPRAAAVATLTAKKGSNR